MHVLLMLESAEFSDRGSIYIKQYFKGREFYLP